MSSFTHCPVVVSGYQFLSISDLIHFLLLPSFSDPIPTRAFAPLVIRHAIPEQLLLSPLSSTSVHWSSLSSLSSYIIFTTSLFHLEWPAIVLHWIWPFTLTSLILQWEPFPFPSFISNLFINHPQMNSFNSVKYIRDLSYCSTSVTPRMEKHMCEGQVSKDTTGDRVGISCWTWTNGGKERWKNTDPDLRMRRDGGHGPPLWQQWRRPS